MATLKYWLWLTTRKGITHGNALQLLDHFGTPEAIHFADPEEYDLVPGLKPDGKKSLLDKSLAEANKILGECEQYGQRILTISDAGYPERLRNIYDPPLVLYLRGRELDLDEQVVIGLVGSREPSVYGASQAFKLGMDLASQGAIIVSGLAKGSDTLGMTGALRGGGLTVGVLGCGLNVYYPRENRYLYEDVTARGVLISEYPPGTEPLGKHFPVRNRIISGLSLGVVVVEGNYKSGTRSTAMAAFEQDRDVFAVPGRLDEPMSYTPNDLIRRGIARLVTSASDVLEEYQAIYPHKIHLKPSYEDQLSRMVPGYRPRQAQAEAEAPAPEEAQEEETKRVDKSDEIPYIHWKKLTPALTDDQRDVLLALEDKALTMDEIIDASQIPARRAASAVTMLQLAGFVNEGAGKRFSATVRIKVD